MKSELFGYICEIGEIILLRRVSMTTNAPTN